jgi:hypothetical protein
MSSFLFKNNPFPECLRLKRIKQCLIHQWFNNFSLKKYVHEWSKNVSTLNTKVTHTLSNISCSMPACRACIAWRTLNVPVLYPVLPCHHTTLHAAFVISALCWMLCVSAVSQSPRAGSTCETRQCSHSYVLQATEKSSVLQRRNTSNQKHLYRQFWHLAGVASRWSGDCPYL